MSGYPAWRAANPEGRFTDWLKAGAEPDWRRAIDHRFVAELAAGSLDAEAFRRYLAQDYAFIETLATVLGFAVARAPEMAAKRRLAGFLALLTSEEDDYFQRAFAALGLDAGPSPALAPATAALRQLMLEAAEAGGYADILSVVVPAEWIYLDWASPRAQAAPPQPHYREWIALHAVPEFAAFVAWLRRELDRLGPALPEAARGQAAARFRRLVALEVAFFDQAYGG